MHDELAEVSRLLSLRKIERDPIPIQLYEGIRINSVVQITDLHNNQVECGRFNLAPYQQGVLYTPKYKIVIEYANLMTERLFKENR